LRELNLHLLDIAENSIAADARNITILLNENTKTDLLQMSVKDDGRGMDAETAARVIDPFVTSRSTRKVGLGIPLLKEAAELCNGYLTLRSQKGAGTELEVVFQRSHIDRMPLGDLSTTILNLVVTNPEVHWTFIYQFDDREFVFDDAPIKQELDGLALTEPPILKILRELLETGVKETQNGDASNNDRKY
jgi:anti-sigma regulatory factor (Ser/Thr protein kinase)